MRVRRGLDRRARREHRHRLTPGRVVRRVAVVLVVALSIAWVSSTFLVQGFAIPSGSMASTLQAGDRVLVSKLVPRLVDVARGDIVVFTDPGGWLDDADATDEGGPTGALRSGLTSIGLLPRDGRQHVVKRVVGLPGDRVASDGDRRVTVNGVPLDETYLAPGTAPSDVRFDVVVPDGHLFVLGDNRAGSADSRAHQGAGAQGFVPLGNVVGSAVTVYWPLGRAGMLHRPAQVFERVDAAAGRSA